MMTTLRIRDPDKKISGSELPEIFFGFQCPYAEIRSHRTSDLAAAEAPSAGVNVDRLAVYDRLNALHVGLPSPIGAPMGMAHLDAVRNTLITEFTLCHLPHLL